MEIEMQQEKVLKEVFSYGKFLSLQAIVITQYHYEVSIRIF